MRKSWISIALWLGLISTLGQSWQASAMVHPVPLEPPAGAAHSAHMADMAPMGDMASSDMPCHEGSQDANQQAGHHAPQACADDCHCLGALCRLSLIGLYSPLGWQVPGQAPGMQRPSFYHHTQISRLIRPPNRA